MVLLTSTKIMIYGNCGVWFTAITFGKADNDKLSLIGNSANNTTPTCLGKGNILEDILNNVTYLKLNQNNDEKYLSLWNKDDQKLT